MKITKKTSKTYEVRFYPDAPMNFTFGSFKETRDKHGLSTRKLETCFICGHKFKDGERPVIITVIGTGNRFACRACFAKYAKEGDANAN